MDSEFSRYNLSNNLTTAGFFRAIIVLIRVPKKGLLTTTTVNARRKMPNKDKDINSQGLYKTQQMTAENKQSVQSKSLLPFQCTILKYLFTQVCFDHF